LEKSFVVQPREALRACKYAAALRGLGSLSKARRADATDSSLNDGAWLTPGRITGGMFARTFFEAIFSAASLVLMAS
jgi:hypothetical protein